MGVKLDIQRLENAAKILKAIAHPVRIAMIDLLHDGKKKSVTEIYEALKMEQAVASHHLSILKDRGVLINNRDGKRMLYSLKHDKIRSILDCINKIS